MRRPLDATSRFRFEYYAELRQAFVVFMRPRWFWQRPSVDEIRDFVRMLAEAKASLVESVISQYPDLAGKDHDINAHGVQAFGERPDSAATPGMERVADEGEQNRKLMQRMEKEAV